MSRSMQLALLFGFLLLAAPVVRVSAEAEEEYEDSDEPAAAPAVDDSEKDVLVLTTKSFDEIINKHAFVLVEFYAPWCGHCKTLAPQYAKAATELKATHSADVILGKVDATVETALGERYEVKGYPTLKWFVDGKPVDYQGPREADGIVSWIKKKTGPPTIVVEDAEKLATVESESPVIVVGYFKELKGADHEVFQKTGAKIEDVIFVETTVEAVAKAAGLTAPGLVVIKNFKGEPREVVTYTGASDTDALKIFVVGEKMPLTIEFNQENSDKIFNSGLKMQVILWAKAADLENGSPVFDAFKKVATTLKGQLVFVVVNNEGATHEPVTNFFGLKDAPSPAVAGFFMEKNQKFKMPAEVSEESILAFAQTVLDGTAQADYKSSPIPEEAFDADVAIIVGKTVESIVFDETKDVLLEIYAPWCGHCKQLDPIWKKLAKRFSKVDSIVIAKMDGTENEYPGLDVKGFPTIFFIPAEKGAKPVEFKEEGRTVKDFTKFLKTNAKVAYTLPKKGEKGHDKDEL